MTTAAPINLPVLVVEDDTMQTAIYSHVLADIGATGVCVGTLAQARAAIARNPFAVAVVDIQLPDGIGIDLIADIHAANPNCVVVIASGMDSVESALAATRAGAFDYLVKPISPTRLGITLGNLIETSRLRAVVRTMEDSGRAGFYNFIGTSPAMQAIYRMIETVSHSKAPVFILGESGTGKELCAEAIHLSSPRREKPFVAINCAAIPAELIESEIFGHAKGAFTGATSDRLGAAAAAHGGTLLLDEICDMDINMQAKLLRLLQTGEVKRVGENRTQQVDIRVVCATNRDPLQEMKAGRFREDLYFRLFVLPIELPPLRERGDDVMLIAQTLLQRYSAEENKTITTFAPEARELLQRHRWPGNVRELINTIRAAVIYTSSATVEAAVIKSILARGPVAETEPASPAADLSVTAPVAQASLTDLSPEAVLPLAVIERQAIEKAIAFYAGNVAHAAAALGVNTSTLYRKIKAWDGEGQKAR